MYYAFNDICHNTPPPSTTSLATDEEIVLAIDDVGKKKTTGSDSSITSKYHNTKDKYNLGQKYNATIHG